MYVDKHTVTYTSFHVQPDQMCIIVSTDILPYPGKYPRTIGIPIVFLSDKMSRETILGNTTLEKSRGTILALATAYCKIAIRKKPAS